MAKKCAIDGAKVVIATKTVKPHPTLPGTIFTAAKEVEDVGGQALPIELDIRYEDQIISAVEKNRDYTRINTRIESDLSA